MALIVGGTLTVGFVAAYAFDAQAGSQALLGMLAVPAVVLLSLATPVTLRKTTQSARQWQHSVEARPAEEVTRPLLASREEYCLILRPFGSDGSTLCHGDPARRRYWAGSPTLTLEQTVQWATMRALNVQTLAVVDQDVTHAPVGPDYLQCPHDGWKNTVAALIRNAHTIFLILPPDQALKTSFSWEVEQISQLDLRSRTVVVLPHPWANARNGWYEAGRRRASHIMAVFQKFMGTFDEITDIDVDLVEKGLPPGALLLKMCARPQSTIQIGHLPGTSARQPVSVEYVFALGQILNLRIQEMSKLSFEERYPGRGLR